jgi:uncharacterized protein (DUF433 family)
MGSYNSSTTGKGAVMQLEDYFDFLAPDDIRLKGHRIGIETVLYEYIHRHQSPEQIAQEYQVSLEKVYATILYYLHNQEAVSKYVAEWLEYCNQSRAENGKLHGGLRENLLARLAEKKAEERESA